ncbi:MAG: hypothetical protein HKN12_11585 [Gemmatimonadetes bacterium]|nr:hypothetical protein [Gemmatimonadota bacterium]
MRVPLRTLRHVGLLALVVLLAPGCGDDQIVYRDRATFNPPPDESSGFLGYFEPETKMTTCGNCHIGKQKEWETTAHADAHAGLVDSGHSQEFCFGCHTVSDMGNDLAVAGGWNVVQDPVYQDVQCESCHGAGFDHVNDPGAAQPLPTLAVSETMDTGCAECHSGNHHPFAEEWLNSGHAQVVSFAAARESCAGCHRGQGALEAWGESANYLEKDSAEHLPITCGVCHDPHERRYEGQLRFPVDTSSPELHLCARCHDRRTVPDANSSHGLAPHSPETALLLGDAGWFPPGSGIDQGLIIASHGSEGNPTLCASCHVYKFEVLDAETGEFVFASTGHSFKALPCLDSQGVPSGDDACNYNSMERSFASCATTGCHSSEVAASSALTAATLRMELFSSDLLQSLTMVDPNLDSAGGEIDAGDPTFTVAEGAYFNYNLANHGGSVIGSATHNPFLTEALLIASINAVFDEYGVRPSRAMDYRAELRKLLERAGRS